MRFIEQSSLEILQKISQCLDPIQQAVCRCFPVLFAFVPTFFFSVQPGMYSSQVHLNQQMLQSDLKMIFLLPGIPLLIRFQNGKKPPATHLVYSLQVFEVRFPTGIFLWLDCRISSIYHTKNTFLCTVKMQVGVDYFSLITDPNSGHHCSWFFNIHMFSFIVISSKMKKIVQFIRFFMSFRQCSIALFKLLLYSGLSFSHCFQFGNFFQ